jgi:hypothetical protein
MEPASIPDDVPDPKTFAYLHYVGFGALNETEEQIMSLFPNVDLRRRGEITKFFKEAKRRRYVKRAILGQAGVPFSKSGVTMSEALEVFSSRG